MSSEILNSNQIKSSTINKTNQIYLFDYIFSKHTITDYSNLQQTSLFLRASIIDWLFIIKKSLKDSANTFFYGIVLLDTYLSKIDIQLDKDQIQLYAAVCYFISKKYNDVVLMSPSFLSKSILKSKYTLAEISKAETDIMKRLNFKLYFDTIQTFIDVFIEHITLPIEKHDFLEMNICINVFSLHVLEFVFEFCPLTLALITFRSSIILFIQNQVIKEDKAKSVHEQMRNHLGEEYHDLYEEIEEMAISLIDTFHSKEQRLKQKEYFQWYFSTFD